MESSFLGRKQLFSGFFFAFLGFMLYQGGRILWPSVGALLGAAVLAVAFFPVHRWLRRRIKSPTWCALLSDLFVLVFFFLPTGWILWAGLAQSPIVIRLGKESADHLLQWAQSSPENTISALVQRFPQLESQANLLSVAFRTQIASLTRQSFALLPRLGVEAVQLIWNVTLAIVALFFFFRDGESLIQQLNQLLPMRKDVKARIEVRVHELVVGATRGAILTSLAQGVAATLGFLMLGLPFAFLLGSLTLVASVIPFVGSALIWLPIAIYYLLHASYGKAVFMLLWGLLVIGSIDNVLRPWLVGFKQDIPFFWLFFSMVGGLQVFGLFGILIGPLVMAVLIILLDIYQHVYAEPRDYPRT